MTRSPLLALLFVGCAPLGDVPDVRVDQAVLVDLDTNTLAVIAGPVGGDALLAWDGPDGSGAIPVSVKGGTVGAVLAMSLDLSPNDNVALDLSETDPDLRLPDLLGTYHGSQGNLTPGIGVAGRSLKNKAGAKLGETQFTTGVGVMAGWEWLRIRVGGHEVEDDDFWSELQWDPFDDTADTASDTGLDTGADTSPPPPPPSNGLGCGGQSAEEPSGCDCSAEDPTGCGACAVAGAPPPLLVLAFSLTMLRRRQRA